MKNVTILGSTGSIGQSALSVIKSLRDRFSVFAIAARRSVELLARQVKEFRPKFCVVTCKEACAEMESLLKDEETELLCGEEWMPFVSAHETTDIVLVALGSSRGIFATLSAIEGGKRIALATKEIIVSFGNIVTDAVRKSGAELLPVDSEHSAIHQCLRGEDGERLKRIILTASGGPFRNRKHLRGIRPSDALNHPVWQMGEKITIDSATMMNKGLEVIEAKWFFSLSPDQIEVVIHPQSIVHSMVEFVDGSSLAQMSYPDMKLPIQYALTYPERIPSLIKQLNLSEIERLEFFRPDHERFPCLSLAYRAAEEGATYPSVLSAANDEAVVLFLDRKIAFTDIPLLIRQTLESHEKIENPGLAEILEASQWARLYVRNMVK